MRRYSSEALRTSVSMSKFPLRIFESTFKFTNVPRYPNILEVRLDINLSCDKITNMPRRPNVLQVRLGVLAVALNRTASAATLQPHTSNLLNPASSLGITLL